MTSKCFVNHIAGFVLVLFILSAVPAAAGAGEPLPGELPALERLASQRMVDFTLISVLRERGAAEVTVYFVQPAADDPRYAGHPARATDVGPLLFDLVAMAESQEPRFEDLGGVGAFTARLGTTALEVLVDNPYVLAIDAAQPHPGTRSSELERITDASHGCSPSSTAACLLGGRFRVTATHGGTSSKVAASSSQSAVLWTFSSSNWEIVAKVLNGCSINGHYWVFSAGATSTSYNLSVVDTNRDVGTFYLNASCPLADTTAFPCP